MTTNQATDRLGDITYFTGDTARIPVTVLDSNREPKDVTGSTFTMSINRTRHPADAADLIAALAGELVTATAGKIAFVVLSTSFDTVLAEDFAEGIANLFYDIQEDNGSTKLTFGTGRFVLKRDITKG